jgi:hypothetical protein
MTNIIKSKTSIRLLLVGDNKWCTTLKNNLISCDNNYQYEILSDFNKVSERLDHNSYDMLLIQYNFARIHSIEFSKKAYAMSRPVLIICNSIIDNIICNLWKSFSKFSNKYKTYKKLVYFKNTYSENSLFLINFLGKNHILFFNDVCNEIDINTNF